MKEIFIVAITASLLCEANAFVGKRYEAALMINKSHINHRTTNSKELQEHPQTQLNRSERFHQTRAHNGE